MFKELNVDLMAKMHFVGFFCVNNNKKADHNNPQMMQFIFCYKNPFNVFNPRIYARKGLI
jgi:hypothetical protein